MPVKIWLSWRAVILTSLKKVVTGGDLFTWLTTQRRNDNHLHRWEKIRRDQETSISEASSDDRVGDFLRLAGSHAPRIGTGRTDLTLNSTEKWRTDFWKDLGALGRTRLNQATASFCTMMLLSTTQLSSSSFSLRKALTVHYHPLYSPDLAPVDYFLFPKVKSNLMGRRFDIILDILNNVTSESEYSGSWFLRRRSEALWPCH